MTGFTRTLALFFLCLILLPAILIVDCPFWVCRITLLDASFHAAVLRDSGVYPAASATLSDSVVRWVEQSPELRPLQRDEIVSALRSGVSEAITPAWMEGEVNRLMSGALGYVKGESPPPRLSVDLREPKARMTEALARSGLPVPLLDLVGASVSRIPDDFVPTSLETEQAVSGLARARPVVWVIMTGGPAGAVVAVVVALIAWLTGQRRPAVARWIGAGAAEAGAVTMAAVAIARIYSLQASATLELPALLSAMRARELAGNTIARVLAVWQAFGVGIAAAGLVLIALSFLPAMRREDRAGAPPAAPV
ncbi:MAG: hypothetical protein ACM3X4_13880 [Ignavibacteriales bacterium]